jgi:hypothetical protein
MISLAPSQSEIWANSRAYDTAPAVVPSDIRQYACKLTQAAYDAWKAGAQSVARMLTESTLETPALREKLIAASERRPYQS